MTALRDARLRRALDAAPDAELRPLPRTREAIWAAAQGAAVPWWRRWRPAAGGGVPWTAALATVALATLVTVLWQREEVPGLHDAPIPAEQASGSAPARKALPTPVVPATVTTGPAAPADPPAARAPATLPPAVPGTAGPQTNAQSEARPSVADAAGARAPVTESAAVPAAGAAAPAPAAVAPAPAAPAPAAPAPAPAPAPAAPPARAEDVVRAAPPTPQAAESTAKAAPRALAVPPPAPAAARAAAARDMRLGPATGWTELTIEGRDLRFSRASQPALQAAVDAVLASPGTPVPRQPAAEGALRLVLQQGAVHLGVLEWAGDAWLWRPGAGEVMRLQAPPAVAQALRDEVGRLAGGR